MFKAINPFNMMGKYPLKLHKSTVSSTERRVDLHSVGPSLAPKAQEMSLHVAVPCSDPGVEVGVKVDTERTSRGLDPAEAGVSKGSQAGSGHSLGLVRNNFKTIQNC